MSKRTGIDRIVWCDVETFGLDVKTDPIIEVGFAVTTPSGDLVDEFQTFIWESPLHDRRMALLREQADQGDSSAKYVLKMHKTSDLWRSAEESGISLREATEEARGFLGHYSISNEPLAGSSVSFDLRMLQNWMPTVAERFSYRVIDISSIKEICARVNPEMFAFLEEDTKPKKAHRVLPDLGDTIREYKWYLDNFFHYSMSVV